jgi:hypothetical protein
MRSPCVRTSTRSPDVAKRQHLRSNHVSSTKLPVLAWFTSELSIRVTVLTRPRLDAMFYSLKTTVIEISRSWKAWA